MIIFLSLYLLAYIPAGYPALPAQIIITSYILFLLYYKSSIYYIEVQKKTKYSRILFF